MNIIDNAFSSTISNFNGIKGAWVSSAYSLMQSGIIHREYTNPRLAQQARKIQYIFNFIDFGWICYGALSFADALQKKSSMSPEASIISAAFVAAVCAIAAKVLVERLDTYFQPYPDPNILLDAVPEEDKKSVSITFKKTSEQRWAQRLLAARILLNIPMVFLSEARGFYLASIISQTYSLVRLTQFKWMKFIKTFEYQTSLSSNLRNPRPKTVTFTYRALFAPKVHASADHCSLCLEADTTTYFCSYHPTHDACLAQQIFATSQKFERNVYERSDWVDSKTNAYVHSTGTLKIRKDQLPECSQRCQERIPFHTSIKAKVIDPVKGRLHKTNVIIPDHTPFEKPLLPIFFERVNLVYNLFHTFLSTMQSRLPEAAATCIKIQRELIAADVALLAWDYYHFFSLMLPSRKTIQITGQMTIDELYKSFPKEKEKIAAILNKAGLSRANPNETLQKARISSLVALGNADFSMDVTEPLVTELHNVVTIEEYKEYLYIAAKGIALPIISLCGVALLNRYLKPSIDLKAVMQQTASLSSEELQSVTFSWDSPLSHKIGQFIYLNRIILNIASSFLTPRKQAAYHLTNAALQTLSLLNISRLPWIKYEIIFTRTSELFASHINPGGDQKTIEQVTLKGYFFIPGLSQIQLRTHP